jgi:hypothetical protein
VYNVPGLGVVGFVVGQVRLENQSRLARVGGWAGYSVGYVIAIQLIDVVYLMKEIFNKFPFPTLVAKN